ncbi:hypothetical protein REPUB_Repub04eG0185200 [Reevesia pubescens]
MMFQGNHAMHQDAWHAQNMHQNAWLTETMHQHGIVVQRNMDVSMAAISSSMLVLWLQLVDYSSPSYAGHFLGSGIATGYPWNYEEQRTPDAPRARMNIDSEFYPQPVKTTESNLVEVDVNREAEDFIKLEHKKFARLSTSMSMKTG